MEALFVPWGLLLLFVCFVCCLLKKWWKVVIGIAVILLGVNWQWQAFSFGFGSLEEHKSDDCLRVMTWNICCADSTGTDNVDGLLCAILEQDADVVFLTEYSRKAKPEIDSLLSIQYPYKDDYPVWVMWGQVYSRVPIDSCMRIGGEEDGYLFRFDVRFSDVKIPIYCLHLQSNNIIEGKQFYPDRIADRGGIMRYLENYKAASKIRREQAELIVNDLCLEPSIVMGDMNDVCGSPCMKVFAEAGLRDAWWDAGSGYGATIHKTLAYRIDHVMYGWPPSTSLRNRGSKFQKVSKGFKLIGIKKVSANGLSDHDALVADFVIK